MITTLTQDPWVQWLLWLHEEDNPETKKIKLAHSSQSRDAILQNARIAPGDTVLDVGCGYGTLAFGALPLVGAQGEVLFCDVSPGLLEHCRALAFEQGVLDRCLFLQASADDLALVETNAVDVVTTRSVLVFVKEKQQAFRELYRVLKPKGRLSIFEPIPEFIYPEPPNLFLGYDVTPVMSMTQKLWAVYKQAHLTEVFHFGVQDLLQFVKDAGFSEVHLVLQAVDAPPLTPKDAAVKKQNWGAFLNRPFYPFFPTLRETIQQALTATEAEQLTNYLRPLVEAGQKRDRWAGAYLQAMKHKEAV
jgi:ubiquinone/menaquinone biosynthesis C-methylase UbiE